MSIVVRYLLPLLAGIGGGLVAGRSQPGTSPPADDFPAKPPSAEVALSEDVEIIKLAALAGRTAEARAKLAELVKAGAADEEIATWLAPVLFADPEWLDAFIQTLPEERRMGLVKLCFGKLRDLNPDSVWELLRHSTFAVTVARWRAPGAPGGSLSLPGALEDSPLAAEVLFDPAFGFTLEEATRFFRTSTRSTANAKRILDEWLGGRWQGEAPGCVRAAWLSLRKRNVEALEDYKAKMPDSLRAQADDYESYAQYNSEAGKLFQDPSPEMLSRLNGRELREVVDYRGISGMPLSLELLSKLPMEKREAVWDSFFEWHYPFHSELAAQEIEKLDQLGLADAEKSVLLKNAAYREWWSQGDAKRVYELASRIPDAAVRAKSMGELMTLHAQADPDGAMEFAGSLPEGEVRQMIEKNASAAMP
ncbi:hypothetical protein [Luteolibacter sp. Populi]|uniref:hypothetical protein n=1 Tax=Luteolibacter sp. Populi TaxID=3230487 RepID=UPI0034659AE4